KLGEINSLGIRERCSWKPKKVLETLEQRIYASDTQNRKHYEAFYHVLLWRKKKREVPRSRYLCLSGNIPTNLDRFFTRKNSLTAFEQYAVVDRRQMEPRVRDCRKYPFLLLSLVQKRYAQKPDGFLA
ncbi:MAG: hypothetical protein P1P64_04730, partial [Treponemataceae bacterium]